MNAWSNREAFGGPCGGLKEKMPEPRSRQAMSV